MALLSGDKLEYHIGTQCLLDRVSFSIEPGERICLLGRNGEGKSTLLKIISGQLGAEDGQLQWQSNCRAALVRQEPMLHVHGSVFDAVAGSLGELSQLIHAYHRASLRLSDDESNDSQQQLQQLQRLQEQLEAADGWLLEQRVEQIISRLRLPAETPVAQLSGGWQRRVALGQALVQEPALLLLDEPTNHLDLETIEWLEEFLLGYPGAVLFVTHDRRFLQKLATRIWELDRGQLTSWPGNYANYLRRVEERQNEEAKHRAAFDKKLAQEEVWIRQGIQARRTRNEGRVRALQALRVERQARVEQQGTAKLAVDSEKSGKLVLEARHIAKSFAGQVMVRDFSCRIMRGDRVGLIGPNGAGKTTLLRLLLGDLKPDNGTVTLGTNLQIAYFDQHRAQLDDDKSVLDNVAEGGDTVQLNGRDLYVISYLKNFLFTPERARAPVNTLSGGERNRLLLARLFTKPVNLLVLDEPTNDLDLETLEVLEDLLAEFAGTLLLVSHDRAFLDNVVTHVFVFEGEGRINSYVGGYQDWLRQRPATRAPVAQADSTKAEQRNHSRPSADNRPRKLSYKEKRELEQLPSHIEQLEGHLNALQTLTAQGDFYQRDAAEIKDKLAELETLQQALEIAYARWETLEAGM